MQPEQPDTLPTFESRIVSFIDILGFKDRIATLESAGDRDQLRVTLSVLRFMAEQTANGYYGDDLPVLEFRDGKVFQRELGDLRFLYASDCMVITAEASPHGLKALCYRIQKIGADLAWDGFFIRGAITVGKVVHKSRVLFGSPYHRVLELEKTAIYPRVIFDQNIVTTYAHSFPFGTKEVRIQDGFTYLSPFPFNLHPPYACSWEMHLRRVHHHIALGITNAEDSRVTDKYAWLLKEWQELTRDYAERKVLADMSNV
jgi:hypothetical protein